ncbi:TauD/TfdA family dioxygenase [Dactylosporangium sp. NPDC000555]|uniref:TauD/TfdA family dioxygenase n=1 Tax=Dactylosporangium sp. NPDC000555 TaxID=3154260 RepID=UPI003321B5D0
MSDQSAAEIGAQRAGSATNADAWRNSAVDQVRQIGFVVINGVENQEALGRTLESFGRMMPQYDGNLTYEVRAEPGFDDRAYSKSQNEIRAHTEAPGWQPPPKYLALWCHVQARGGGGETCLADVKSYLRGLDRATVKRLRSWDIAWGGANMSGRGSAGVVAPMLAPDGSGDEVLRFSYNLLTSGEYDPPLDGAVPEERLPWGRFGLDLAHQVHAHFNDTALKIRIPENAVLLWDNQRLAHARTLYVDPRRHLTRYWIAEA